MDDALGESPTLASALSGAGQLVAGRYRIRARLGRGASKDVYLAYDERLDREIALAIVAGTGDNAAARARVEREARVTGRLGDHPNVITVYDSGELDGVPYLVLRAMRGGSLADALRAARLPAHDAVRIGGEIAAALAHAHAHGVVHRDVKPDNVWLAADGAAALGDFGVAHELGSERLTAEGMIVGTVRYLAPEQIRGEEISPASDVYALGVTLYELVTGRPPFTGSDPEHVFAQHLDALPTPPSQLEPTVPAALERLILELLAKAPEQRLPSAAAVVQALAAMATVSSDPSRRPDARRHVSVLAARVEHDDPEALHGALDRCAEVIEGHGGTVERYLGDTLVGLFGVAGSQGDDGLRAARAALDLLAVVPDLRAGIEAGEVFLGERSRGATVATGAAITTAGRLAERAAAGEILLGDRIRHAVAAHARIDAASGRLLELQVERPALLRAPEGPLVGRARELEILHAAFAQARDERVCRVVTVVGSPGIGKSRLAAEFVAAVGADATVLAGRCLAYGEGTTYRALVDIVRGLGGDPQAQVEQLLAGDQQAIRGILAAIGLSDEPVRPEETAWALRRLLQRLAGDRPLVVAIEDIHWAERALLDLLDQVAALSSGSPIMMLCLTRPELLESHPAWVAPQANRSVLVLDALAEEQARELAERLGARGPALRIARRAEGNPLFVEQLVAVDAGEGDGELPASIQAVLAARIDGLEPGERMLLQRASVEGRTFHAGALATLLPVDERAGVGARLVALTRKALIGADQPEFAGEEAFRFTHALIGEAAYAGMPKLERADLHGRLADWLEARLGAPDAVVGHHLEQACLLAADIGRQGDATKALAARGAARLASAARASVARGDPAAAAALLERAMALVSDDEAARTALQPALGAALFEAGSMREAALVLDAAIAAAPSRLVRARARVERAFVRLEADAGSGTGIVHARGVVDAAAPVFEAADDQAGQCRAWSLRAQLAWLAGRVAEADEAWSEAAACAERAGDELERFRMLGWQANAAALGPMPVDAAIERCRQLRELVSASPVAVAWTINPLATLHAMRGDADRAEMLLAEANATLSELGTFGADLSHHEVLVRLLTGRPDLAEASLRAGVAALQAISDARLLATTTAMLAQAVYAQGRFIEAEDLCRRTAESGVDDDILTQAIWRGVRAKVLAHDGRFDEAERLARAAVAIMAPTDLRSHHADAMVDLAEVLEMSPRSGESEHTARGALALYEQKGNVAGAARARSLLTR